MVLLLSATILGKQANLLIEVLLFFYRDAESFVIMLLYLAGLWFIDYLPIWQETAVVFDVEEI